MKYKHLTKEERYYIEQRKANQIAISVRQLAREMSRSPSTISRELRRNLDVEFGFYSGIKAQSLCAERYKSRVIKKIDSITDTIKKVLFSMLQERTSPEQICGRLKHKHGIRISHPTLYRYINADRLNGGNLYLNLRHGTTRYKRKADKYNACATSNQNVLDKGLPKQPKNGKLATGKLTQYLGWIRNHIF